MVSTSIKRKPKAAPLFVGTAYPLLLHRTTRRHYLCPRCSDNIPGSEKGDVSKTPPNRALSRSFQSPSLPSLPSLPDFLALSQRISLPSEKVQVLYEQFSELWQLASSPGAPVYALTSLSAFNDVLLQFVEQKWVFQDEPPLPIPSAPLFDPILSLQLAAYAFRAYLDPPASAYWELLTSDLPTSKTNVVHNRLAYLDTSFIASAATGLFMIHATADIGDAFVTATINRAISENLFALKHVTILRCELRGEGNEQVLNDLLTLQIFASKEDYTSGAQPTHSASVDVHSIVEEANKLQETVHREPHRIVFHPEASEQSRSNYFNFSWPTDLGFEMPSFPFSSKRATRTEEDKNEAICASIQVSFVPFIGDEKTATSTEPKPRVVRRSFITPHLEAIAETALTVLRDAVEKTSLRNTSEYQDEEDKGVSAQKAREAVKDLLRSKLPDGVMPTPSDWNRFIIAASSLYETVENKETTIAGAGGLTRLADGTLFLESLSTDTQVWLFHDKTDKNLIISFRGTEQVKWQDFFTDAQAFLQRWVPGEDIDLTIRRDLTVGLQDLVPNVLQARNMSDPIPDDAIAVHYGFLRAYLSVQTTLLRCILSLTSNLEEDYKIYFTGHSLGGALAIVAAADFVARHRREKVCCMSYGAPKVGNLNFARMYNDLVPNSFRVINDTDIISRMPRSVSGEKISKYKHSGRTVLVNRQGEYWIEGVNESVLQKGRSVFDVIQERYCNASDMLEVEQKLWDDLLSGRSVQHHMECSYFTAMHQVVKRSVMESIS
ncbi:Lipase [Gracilariopsis chorda]|uniref:Lipase n=1 Tax=Gracilariopsis chorda TaxID=448386 RepID=A0A2V3IFT4_9FLOR|nr:Lipase [Gracilariopsis chorda]|eukprot:PXF40912.1 Lipase [Gracilariopsis chorda]